MSLIRPPAGQSGCSYQDTGSLESHKGRDTAVPSPAARRFRVGLRAWAAEKAVPAPAVFHVEQPGDGARGRTDATACPSKTPPGLISPAAWGSRSPADISGRTRLSAQRQPGIRLRVNAPGPSMWPNGLRLRPRLRDGASEAPLHCKGVFALRIQERTADDISGRWWPPSRRDLMTIRSQEPHDLPSV